MPLVEKVIPNLYRDSVSLMQLSTRISGLAGITRAAAVMATRANLALLAEAGLSSGTVQPHPNHVLVIAEGTDEASIAGAMAEVEAALRSSSPPSPAAPTAGVVRPTSIAMAVEQSPDANMALISTPGEYAVAEAIKALRLGLNVMLFSNNIAVEDEIRLKRWARDHGRIVMGPDCGTAIVNGIPLGFANVVRRGPIGVAAASGTGLQEVTRLIDHGGLGVSQAIGTGGRDLSDQVGGIAMLQALAALAADPSTRVIVLVSKPPSPRVAQTIRQAAEQCGKPVVIDFLGSEPAAAGGHNIHAAETLEDAADIALALARGTSVRRSDRPVSAATAVQKLQLDRRQRYIRGLYSGGTLCYEALLLLQRELGPVWSNTPLDPACALPDVWASREHTAIDLGADVFTRWRPHPMIDQRLRNERIIKEANDAETAVILFDVVLGHGASPDPATTIADAIEDARRATNRQVAFVASICGTAGDPQNLERQENILRDAGVLLAPSNAAAARLAAQIALAQR